MDSSRRAAGRRRTDRLVALFAVLAVCAGAWVVTSGDGPRDSPHGHFAESRPADGPLAAHRRLADDLAHPRGSRRAPGALWASAPLRLRIPALRIDAAVGSAGPAHRRGLSWDDAGPTPGERGSALILGHTGTAALPGSFHRLAALRPGDRVHAVRADGSTATFTVEWVGGAARAVGTAVRSRTGPERARLRARGGTGAGRGEGRAQGPRLRLFGCAGAPPACRVAVTVVARLTHVSH
ncbi:sortase domain-bontaining protein [Streptomyces sp. NPDC101132]|uniref:sortase domain-containing protein n=1 Tax=Streptomyces sp. NPDC101132 TaxID=3366110 RepID=UPI00381404DF